MTVVTCVAWNISPLKVLPSGKANGTREHIGPLRRNRGHSWRVWVLTIKLFLFILKKNRSGKMIHEIKVPVTQD